MFSGLSQRVAEFHNTKQNCTPPSDEQFPSGLFTQEQRENGAIIVHVLVTLYMFATMAVICHHYFVPAIERFIKGKNYTYLSYHPGEGTPILVHCREVPQWLPPIWVPIGPYFMLHYVLIDPPLSAEKIGLSLSHLVPKISRPKVGLMFHQNVLFNCF